VLATLGLSAHLLGRAVADLAASVLLRSAPLAAPMHDQATIERLPGAAPPDVRGILARNIFDAASHERPEEREAMKRPSGSALTACAERLRLVAVMFSHVASRSLATVAIDGAAPKPYREGSWVGKQRLVKITPRAVQLRSRSGRSCSLRLFAAEGNYVFEPQARPGPYSESELALGIREQNGKRTLQRSFVERVLREQASAIGGSVRAVPHQQDGRLVGVKLYGISRNHLLAELGLQNGDVLRTINGLELASPDQALDAYAKLRNASHFSVALVRRDRPLTLVYEIRP
jgi:general secretion pathway protein C